MQWYNHQTNKLDYAVGHNLEWWSDNYGDTSIIDATKNQGHLKIINQLLVLNMNLNTPYSLK
jgi:hypothetical protein